MITTQSTVGAPARQFGNRTRQNCSGRQAEAVEVRVLREATGSGAGTLPARAAASGGGRFRQDRAIPAAGELVCRLRRGALAAADSRPLLRPALIDARETPLGAALRRANRPSAGKDEDRVGMRRAEDAQRDPAAALDVDLQPDVVEAP